MQGKIPKEYRNKRDRRGYRGRINRRKMEEVKRDSQRSVNL